MEKAKSPGWNQHRGRSNGATDQKQTLTDLGISKTQSAQWQQVAKIPVREFEAAIEKVAIPTTNALTQSGGSSGNCRRRASNLILTRTCLKS
jgi:hypothetical protein